MLRKLGLFSCAMTITPYCAFEMYFMKQRGCGECLLSDKMTFPLHPGFTRLLGLLGVIIQTLPG